jgi:hypothetical protein
MVRKLSFLVLFLVLTSGGFVQANQGLNFEITTTLGDLGQATLNLGTRENGTGQIVSSGVDTYDAILPSDDKSDLILRSMIDSSTSRYILDIWDAKLDPTRTLEVRLQVLNNANNTGNLVLSWNSDDLKNRYGEEYYFTLKDYRNDSNFNTVIEQVNMRTSSSYTVWNNISTRYFRIETRYSYCGDGVVSGDGAWKTCDEENLREETCSSRNPIYHSGTLKCSLDCRSFDTSECITDLYCGDGIITSGLEEKCDFVNGNAIFEGGKNSCTDWGYAYGTLSCISPNSTNECKLDASQCFSADGTPGPSGGGSSGIFCQDECILGQRRCVGEDTYQVCGLFGGDSCARWGNVETCLGVNPFCRNGFCFGCVTDDDCLDGWCVNGKCETDCGKSCEDLGLECGNRLVCGVMLNCGTCGEGSFCKGGKCSGLPEGAMKISDKDCFADYLCSPWSECKVSFDSKTLLSGVSWFSGKRNRICFDANKCYSTIREEEDCLLKIEVSTREVEICGIKYIEVYDKKTDRLLARTRDLRYQLSRAIEVFLLPGEIDCVEEEISFKVSLIDRLMFLLDFRNLWRIFI